MSLHERPDHSRNDASRTLLLLLAGLLVSFFDGM